MGQQGIMKENDITANFKTEANGPNKSNDDINEIRLIIKQENLNEN